MRGVQCSSVVRKLKEKSAFPVILRGEFFKECNMFPDTRKFPYTVPNWNGNSSREVPCISTFPKISTRPESSILKLMTPSSESFFSMSDLSTYLRIACECFCVLGRNVYYHVSPWWNHVGCIQENPYKFLDKFGLHLLYSGHCM